MAAKGYCASQDVADFLGETFTGAQTTHCDALIERAETYIDEETNRGWLVGAQTDETFYHPPYYVLLRYTPVASVSAVTGRAGLGESDTTLTVDEDYEVRDLESGLIYLVTPMSYDRLQVDYTPVASVPGDIKAACIELVANQMQQTLTGTYGLDSYSLPDLTVKFSRVHTQTAAPPRVQQILDRYRYRVHG